MINARARYCRGKSPCQIKIPITRFVIITARAAKPAMQEQHKPSPFARMGERDLCGLKETELSLYVGLNAIDDTLFSS